MIVKGEMILVLVGLVLIELMMSEIIDPAGIEED